MNDVHVGSSRYIREVCSNGATHDDELDPVVRRFLFTDDVEVDAGESGGDDGATSALSVSFLLAEIRMRHISVIAAIDWTLRVLRTNSGLHCRQKSMFDTMTRMSANSYSSSPWKYL